MTDTPDTPVDKDEPMISPSSDTQTSNDFGDIAMDVISTVGEIAGDVISVDIEGIADVS